MIGIFHGRGIANAARVHAQIDVDLRRHLHEFNNGRNLNALGVFLCVALHASEQGWAWPGRSLIKKETGIGTEHALTGALAHLRQVVIDGNRVFSHYRVQNPETKRWGRSAYLIFPDLPHEAGPFDDLVEYNPLDPIVGNRQVDDPHVGYPLAGDQQQEAEPTEVEPDQVEPLQQQAVVAHNLLVLGTYGVQENAKVRTIASSPHVTPDRIHKLASQFQADPETVNLPARLIDALARLPGQKRRQGRGQHTEAEIAEARAEALALPVVNVAAILGKDA